MKSLYTYDDVALIHHKYYSKPIKNIRLSEKEDNDCLTVVDFVFAHHPLDTCISDCLKTGVLFEKFLLSFVEQFIDPSKNVLDIGANIGVHSVVFSNYAKNAKVYSFEPQPVIFEYLKKNLRMNKCDNVVPLNFGASDSENTFFMNAHYDTTDNHGAFSICEKDDSIKGIYIECKPVDSLELENIGFIKIDVEGHELNTLKGLKNTILNNKNPILMIEIHESSSTFKEVFDLIENYGYTSYYKLSHCDYIFN